jgi:branched-chain amino acid transport system substrate-binding protein
MASDKDRKGFRGLSRRTFLKAVGGAGLGSLGGPYVPRQISAAEKGSIKIGGLASLSGVVSAWGKVTQQGLVMAVDDINQAGGILGRKAEYLMEDDESKPAEGARKARRLALDWGANVLIGINHSGVAVQVCALLPELKTILIIPCASVPSVTNEKFTKYTFRTKPNSYQLAAAGAYRMKDLPWKKWTVLGPDYSYGHESWEAFGFHLKKVKPDVQVLEAQAWPKFGAGDYASHIVKILDAKPDAVYCPLWGGDMINFIKQAVQYNFFEKVGLATEAGLSTDIFYALGKTIPEGLWSASHGYWFEHPNTPKNRDFISRFLKRWGEYPHVTAHDTYVAVYAYKQAVEKARTADPDAVVTAMEGLEFETPAYKSVIRKEDHQAIRDVPWGVTKRTDKLPFGVHLTDVKDTPGHLIAQPLEEVLKLRMKG